MNDTPVNVPENFPTADRIRQTRTAVIQERADRQEREQRDRSARIRSFRVKGRELVEAFLPWIAKYMEAELESPNAWRITDVLRMFDGKGADLSLVSRYTVGCWTKGSEEDLGARQRISFAHLEPQEDACRDEFLTVLADVLRGQGFKVEVVPQPDTMHWSL